MEDLALIQLRLICGDANVRKKNNVIVVKRKNCIIKFLIMKCYPKCQYEYAVLKKVKYSDNYLNLNKELDALFMIDNVFIFFKDGISDVYNIHFTTKKWNNQKVRFLKYTYESRYFSDYPCESQIYYHNENSINSRCIFNCCYDGILDCYITTGNHFMYNLSIIKKESQKIINEKYMMLSQIIQNTDMCRVIGYFIYLIGYQNI